MNYFFLFAFVAFAYPTHGAIQSMEQLIATVTEAKKECFKQAPVSGDAIRKFVFQGFQPVDQHFMKYAHCMNVRLGFQHPNSTFIPDVMKETSRILVNGSHIYDKLIELCVGRSTDFSLFSAIKYLTCALTHMDLATFFRICKIYYQLA